MFARLFLHLLPPGGVVRKLLLRPAAWRRSAVVLLGAATAALLVAPAAVAALSQPHVTQESAGATAASDQVLVWTSGNDLNYDKAPATAVAGPATIVFENSAATGNTTGIVHNLTFSTTKPGFNHDVDVNLSTSPSQGGRVETQVTLTAGKYYYFCDRPGHAVSGMSGVLVVTASGSGSDTAAPQVSAQVSGDRNADGAYVGSASVAVSASDAGSGVDTVEYALDGGAWMSYDAPVSVDAPGQHTVTYRATDKAGNTSDVGSVSFTVVASAPVDTTAPQVSAQVSGDRNADGAYVGSASVAVSASDAGSGVDTVEYALDGGAWMAYGSPVSVDAPGQHTVTYRATDKAGNTSEPGSVSFMVLSGGSDGCPGSDTSDTVVIDGVDTGVANVDTGNGCTISDLIAADASYHSHGAFVSHVGHVTARLKADGVITGQEKGRIMRAAAHSDVGK